MIFSGKSDGGHLASVKGLDWKGIMMNCDRCGGGMVYEKFYGSQDFFWGWRCITCGEILDQIILENRGGRVVRARIAKSLMARKKDYRTPPSGGQ
jgi:hypothetical protein